MFDGTVPDQLQQPFRVRRQRRRLGVGCMFQLVFVVVLVRSVGTNLRSSSSSGTNTIQGAATMFLVIAAVIVGLRRR